MHRSRTLLRLVPLLGLSLLAPGLAAAPAPRAAGGELGVALDRYLSTLVRYGYSGAALVARRGEIILDRGYGLADRARGVPFTADTLFDIASISKPFTAAAVLRLEMQGKLKVEDPLGRFFPSAPADKAAITLHQLLTHTSGLPESVGPEYEALAREAFLRRVFAARLRHRAGGRFLYSNAGYAVLAAVVEVVSGRPFGQFLHDEVFAPAGMRHSGYLPQAGDRERVAHGYTRDGDWGTPLDHPRAPDGPWWNLRGNGGVLTTTGDLYRWDVALQGDGVLSAAEREKFQRGYVAEGRGQQPRYAYGWSVSTSLSAKRELSHVGSNEVFQSAYRRFPEDGIVIAVASNAAEYSAIAIADQIENRLFGKTVAEPPKTLAAAEDRRRCGGTFALPSGERLEVVAEPGRLAVTPDGREGLVLLFGGPAEEHRGRYAERGAEVDRGLAEALRGRFDALGDVLGVEADEAEPRWRAALAASQAELGAWKSAAVLGTGSSNGQVATHARLGFEKGTRVLDVMWAGPTAESIAVRRGLRPTYFLPEGAGRYVTYDVGTDTIVHLACVGNGASASGLRFETASATVEARRLPAAATPSASVLP